MKLGSLYFSTTLLHCTLHYTTLHVISLTTQAYTSLIFIAIYVMEVVLGVIAYTCILHPKGYLRRGWTALDLAVILFG